MIAPSPFAGGFPGAAGVGRATAAPRTPAHRLRRRSARLRPARGQPRLRSGSGLRPGGGQPEYGQQPGYGAAPGAVPRATGPALPAVRRPAAAEVEQAADLRHRRRRSSSLPWSSSSILTLGGSKQDGPNRRLQVHGRRARPAPAPSPSRAAASYTLEQGGKGGTFTQQRRTQLTFTQRKLDKRHRRPIDATAAKTCVNLDSRKECSSHHLQEVRPRRRPVTYWRSACRPARRPTGTGPCTARCAAPDR